MLTPAHSIDADASASYFYDQRALADIKRELEERGIAPSVQNVALVRSGLGHLLIKEADHEHDHVGEPD